MLVKKFANSGIKSTAIFVLSDLISFASNALVFILLLNRISQIEYGRYAFAYSLSFWFISLILFAMNYNGVRLLQIKENQNWNKIAFFIFFKLILFFSAFFVLFVLYLNNLINFNSFIAISIMSFVQVFQVDFVYIAFKSPQILMLGRVLTAVSFFSIILIFITPKSSFLDVVFYQVASTLIGFTVLYYNIQKHIPFPKSSSINIDFKQIVPFFKSGYQTTIAQFFQAGYLNMDVIVFGLFFANSSKLGQYSACAKLLLTGLVPMGSILNASGASISSAYLNQDFQTLKLKLNQLKLISFLLGIIGFIVLFLFGSKLLHLISNKEMSDTVYFMLPLSVVYIFYGIQLPFFATLPFLKKDFEFLIISAGGFCISIITSTIVVKFNNLYFIPIIPISYASFLAFSSYIVNKKVFE